MASCYCALMQGLRERVEIDKRWPYLRNAMFDEFDCVKALIVLEITAGTTDYSLKAIPS